MFCYFAILYGIKLICLSEPNLDLEKNFCHDTEEEEKDTHTGKRPKLDVL